MTDQEILAKADHAEGWCSEAEGLFLYRTAQRCPGKGTIVEIGSWKGKSTIFLALGSLAGARTTVYAIDPHDCVVDSTTACSMRHQTTATTLDEFYANLKKAGVEHIDHSIVCPSDDAVRGWNRPIEFLWIDGDHSYEATRRDIENWSPHLADGGVIAIHDSTPDGSQPGTRHAVMDCIFSSKFFASIGAVDSVTYATRSRVHRGLGDSVKGQYLLASYRSFDLGRRMLPQWVRDALRTSVHKMMGLFK
jgi:predicted O-methyltransferase YrrM